METFADIIDMWPTQLILADDVSREHDRVVSNKVALWKWRNKISAKYWIAVVLSAEKQGIAGITLERLAKIAEASRHPKPPER